MMARCKACSAEIVWARSENDRNVPFDPEPSENGKWKLIEGQPLTASYVRPENRHLEPVLHLSHWEVCPKADRFRQGRVAEPPKYLAFALCPECGRKFYGVLSDSKCGSCLDRDRIVSLIEAKLEKANG